MRLAIVVVSIAVITAVFINGAYGHGKMTDPPGRNALMNEQDKNAAYTSTCNTGSINYSDKGQNCGGRGTQENNNGLCSACGDNFKSTYPRKHDYKGSNVVQQITPVRVYLQGQNITVKVYISAQHKGWFEFRVCNLNEADEVKKNNKDELTKCFNDEFDDRNFRLKTTSNALKYYGEHNDPVLGINQNIYYTVHLMLPSDLVCPKGCNLQWKWVSNNSPGSFPEHFVNCADIVIISCADYKAGKTPEHCGYGPTSELKTCTPGSGNGQQPTGQGQGTGNAPGQGGTGSPGTGCGASNGDTQNTAPSSGGQQQGDGGQTWQAEAGPTETGSSSGIMQSPEARLCDQCPPLEENCVHSFCEKIYTSQHFSLNNWWCNINCNLDPPYCPDTYCKTVWVPKQAAIMGSKRKRILALIDKMLRKEDETVDRIDNKLGKGDQTDGRIDNKFGKEDQAGGRIDNKFENGGQASDRIDDRGGPYGK